ncbi:MAG: hypothetical protein ACYTGL_15915 [Planctomycetota bacterium]
MVAPVTQTPMAKTGQEKRNTHRYGPVCEWRLVDHFNTVEEAERELESLRMAGVEAELSLIDGLCVIARRTEHTKDPTLC